MYWIKERKIVNGITYKIYQYFTLEPRPLPTNHFYNPITKQTQHVVKEDLNVCQRIAMSEEEFLMWYKMHVKL